MLRSEHACHCHSGVSGCVAQVVQYAKHRLLHTVNLVRNEDHV